MKPLAEMHSKFFRKFASARRHEIDVASCGGRRRYRRGAKHNYVIAPAQKFQHGFVNSRQRQRLAHGKLLKCENSRVQHQSNNTLLSSLLQDRWCSHMTEVVHLIRVFVRASDYKYA